jgi:hypothetical protein
VELRVKITIQPPPDTVSKQEVDRLLDGELTRFEKYFSHIQQKRGLDGAPLASFERGVIKAYLYYAATERDADV